MFSTILTVLQNIAPTLAKSLKLEGFSAMTKDIICGVLGIDTSENESVIAEHLKNLTPKQFVELKKKELELSRMFAQYDVKLEKIDQKDRKNARAREIATGDKTQRIVAFLMFGMIYMLLFFTFYATVTKLSGQGMRIIDFLAGQSFIAVLMIFRYYFGGSSTEQKSHQALVENSSRTTSIMKRAQNMMSSVKLKSVPDKRILKRA